MPFRWDHRVGAEHQLVHRLQRRFLVRARKARAVRELESTHFEHRQVRLDVTALKILLVLGGGVLHEAQLLPTGRVRRRQRIGAPAVA